MDWNGNEKEKEKDGDGYRTWESLTPANSLVNAARLHRNIELEQDKPGELMPHLFAPPDTNSDRPRGYMSVVVHHVKKDTILLV
jgi:hypothetical protein